MSPQGPTKRGGVYRFGFEQQPTELSPDEMPNVVESTTEARAWLGSFENALREIQWAEDQAWKLLLSQLNVKRADGYIRIAGSDWRPLGPGEALPSENTNLQFCLAERLPYELSDGNPEPTVEWAAKVIGLALRVRQAIERRDAGGAVSFALALGKHLEAGRVEFGLARILSVGRKVTDGVDLGADSRRGQVSPETTTRLQEIARHIADGHPVSNAARLAAKNGFGPTAEANRKLWQRHSKSR